MPSTRQTRNAVPKTLKRKKADTESDDEDQGDAFETSSEDDEVALDSDNLDDDEEEVTVKKSKKRSPSKSKPTPKKTPSKKRRKKAADSEEELELEEGQQVVGAIVRAPTTGLVPPGQISQNTFDFLTLLMDPKCNDREWFKLHEPVYRHAEKEWKDFVEQFTDLIVEADSQIPPLPPKDVIHRIYRDVRFSNNKTPYKTNLSASFSRSGRKGIFAGYHVAIRPGDGSIIAAGTWCPGKNELQTIRANIQRSSTRLREAISAPKFVKLFGKAKPLPDGGRRNIFGAEDELKVAPKGVPKTHPDIDLLKCRSFAVSYRFTDEMVLAPGFKEQLKEMVELLQPFVHCLNDMMTLQDAGGDSDEGEEEEAEE